MTQPLIRTRRRRDLGLTELATQVARLAPEIELGWNHLIDELRDAGWPTRTPEDDRRPQRTDNTETPEPYEHAWRCSCGNTFTTFTEADTHQQHAQDDTVHDTITRVRAQHTTTGINYPDPTGQQAATFAAWTGDLAALQDHLAVINHSLHALRLIATRHRPPATPATPGCIITNCDQPVESRILPGGHRTYLGMEQIAGHWVAKHGATPMCKTHRARRRNSSAA